MRERRESMARRRRRAEPKLFPFRTSGSPVFATHDATHNRRDLHVLRRTYAAVRDLQVVEGRG